VGKRSLRRDPTRGPRGDLRTTSSSSDLRRRRWLRRLILGDDGGESCLNHVESSNLDVILVLRVVLEFRWIESDSETMSDAALFEEWCSRRRRLSRLRCSHEEVQLAADRWRAKSSSRRRGSEGGSVEVVFDEGSGGLSRPGLSSMEVRRERRRFRGSRGESLPIHDGRVDDGRREARESWTFRRRSERRSSESGCRGLRSWRRGRMMGDGSDGLSMREPGWVRDGRSEGRRSRRGCCDVSCCFEVKVAVSEERKEVVLHLLVDLTLSEEHATGEKSCGVSIRLSHPRSTGQSSVERKGKRSRETRRDATHLLLALANPLLPVPFTNLLISSPHLSSISSSPNNPPPSSK